MTIKSLLIDHKSKAIPIIIIFFSIVLAIVLIKLKPSSDKVNITPTALPVDVVRIRRQDLTTLVHSQGNVIPAKFVELRPQVSGEVIALSPSLVPGGYFKQGEELIKIDPRDYENAVEQQKSKVQNAIFNLKEEKGRKLVAEQEWKLLGSDLFTTDLGKDLALRDAHIQKANSELRAAESALKNAELALKRTVIYAPFNAIVKEEFVDIGQTLTPQNQIVSLIGTDSAWIEIALPIDELRWLTLPDKTGQGGSSATIKHQISESHVEVYSGKVIRLLGNIKEDTRTARLLIEVEDPLGLHGTSHDSVNKVPLLIGAWVSVDLKGRLIEDALAIPDIALREGQRVFLADKNKTLQIRSVDILKRSSRGFVLLDNGPNDGELIITSRVAVPLPGQPLEILSISDFKPGDTA
jgi:RND family efflux transporter MFP subunit